MLSKDYADLNLGRLFDQCHAMVNDHGLTMVVPQKFVLACCLLMVISVKNKLCRNILVGNNLLNLFSKKSLVGPVVFLLLFVSASNSSGSLVCGKILFPLQKQKVDVLNVFSLFS